jgi:hypothetical protein
VGAELNRNRAEEHYTSLLRIGDSIIRFLIPLSDRHSACAMDGSWQSYAMRLSRKRYQICQICGNVVEVVSTPRPRHVSIVKSGYDHIAPPHPLASGSARDMTACSLLNEPPAPRPEITSSVRPNIPHPKVRLWLSLAQARTGFQVIGAQSFKAPRVSTACGNLSVHLL